MALMNNGGILVGKVSLNDKQLEKLTNLPLY